MDNIKNSKKQLPKLASKLTLGMALSATVALGVGCDYAKTAMQSELKNDNTALQIDKQNLVNKPVEENSDTTDIQAVNEGSNVVQIGSRNKSDETKKDIQSNIADKDFAVEVLTNKVAGATGILKSSIAFVENKKDSIYPVKSEKTETSIYDFEYELNDNDEVVIKKYTGTDKEIVIPEDFNGYSVVEIGSSAFYNNRNITSVTLPSTVKKISNNAFYYCTELVTVNFNEGLEEIGDSAFNRCYKLSSVKIPDSCLMIGSYAFYYCSGLVSLDLGKGVQTIESYAFEHNDSLTSITIPDSVTLLEDRVFYQCFSLSSVVIGKGLTSIPSYAFSYSAISTLNIPDNIQFIKNNTFRYCDKLTEVNGGTGLKEIGDYTFADCDGFTEFTIPDTVVKVGNYTWGNCNNLTTLNIGKDVDNFTTHAIKDSENIINIIASGESVHYTSWDGCLYSKDFEKLICVGKDYEKDFVWHYNTTVIGEYAFSHCQKISSITFPENIVSVERYAFEYCTNLTSAELSDKTEYLGDYAFSNCTSLKSIDLGKKLTCIGEYGFYNCSSLETVELPDTVTIIKRYGFHNCKKLTSAKLSSNLKTIEKTAFYNCYALKAIDIPNSVTTIGTYAFENCEALEKMTLGLGIKTIPEGLAYECMSLKEITIPENVETIDRYAFEYCYKLSNVKFNNKLTKISDSAFAYCDALTDVKIPDNVKTIGYTVFAHCDKLTTLNIGSGVTSFTVGVVDETPSLTSINVSGENTALASLEGVLFNKEMTKLITYPRAKAGNYKIPEKVVTVGNSAFEDCKALTGITMSKALTTIENYAFIRCDKIPALEFYDNLKTVGYEAFRNCSALTSVKLGINTESISNRAFYECASIENFDFGKSLTSVGEWAFYKCGKLTSVVLPDTVTTLGREAFCRCDSLKTVTLSSGLKTINQYAFEYCSLLESIEIPDSVTRIYYGAFNHCSLLKSIKIGRGVVEFPYELYECTALESITVADENTTYASYNGVLFNKDLTNLMKYPSKKSGDFVIPDTVNTISASAFRDAKNLTSIKEYGNVLSVGSNAFYNIDKANFKAYVIEGSYLETYLKNSSIPYETMVDTRTNINSCTVTYDSYVKYTGGNTGGGSGDIETPTNPTPPTPPSNGNPSLGQDNRFVLLMDKNTVNPRELIKVSLRTNGTVGESDDLEYKLQYKEESYPLWSDFSEYTDHPVWHIDFKRANTYDVRCLIRSKSSRLVSYTASNEAYVTNTCLNGYFNGNSPAIFVTSRLAAGDEAANDDNMTTNYLINGVEAGTITNNGHAQLSMAVVNATSENIKNGTNTITAKYSTTPTHYRTVSDMQVVTYYPADTVVNYIGDIEYYPDVVIRPDFTIFEENIYTDSEFYVNEETILHCNVYNRNASGGWVDIIVKDGEEIIYKEENTWLGMFTGKILNIPWTPKTRESAITVELINKCTSTREADLTNNKAERNMKATEYIEPSFGDTGNSIALEDRAFSVYTHTLDNQNVTSVACYIDDEEIKLSSANDYNKGIKYWTTIKGLSAGNHKLRYVITYDKAGNTTGTIEKIVDINVISTKSSSTVISKNTSTNNTSAVVYKVAGSYSIYEPDSEGNITIIYNTDMYSNRDLYKLAVYTENGVYVTSLTAGTISVDNTKLQNTFKVAIGLSSWKYANLYIKNSGSSYYQQLQCDTLRYHNETLFYLKDEDYALYDNCDNAYMVFVTNSNTVYKLQLINNSKRVETFDKAIKLDENNWYNPIASGSNITSKSTGISKAVSTSGEKYNLTSNWAYAYSSKATMNVQKLGAVLLDENVAVNSTSSLSADTYDVYYTLKTDNCIFDIYKEISIEDSNVTNKICNSFAGEIAAATEKVKAGENVKLSVSKLLDENGNQLTGISSLKDEFTVKITFTDVNDSSNVYTREINTNNLQDALTNVKAPEKFGKYKIALNVSINTYADIIIGDINGDGKLGIIDTIRMMRFIIGIDNVNDSQAKAADMDMSNTVTLVDVLTLQRTILGIKQ